MTISLMDINYTLCYFMCAIMISPLLYRNVPSIIMILIFGGWIITTVMCIGKIKISKPLIAIGSSIILVFTYYLLGISTTAPVHHFQVVFFWIPFLFYSHYCEYGNSKRNKKLIKLLIFTFTVSLIINSVLLIIYPGASEILQRVEGSIYDKMNIGETPYSFASALLFILSVDSFLSSKKKIFLFTGLVSLIYCILMGRTIVILIMLIGIVVLNYYKKSYKKNLSSKFVSIFRVIIILLIAIVLYMPIVTTLATAIGAENRIIDRLIEMGSMLFGRNMGYISYSGKGHIAYIQNSVNTWTANLHNFTFGVGYPEIVKTHYLIVGGHSGFIDWLAKYGVVGLIIVLSAFISSRDFICSKVPDQYEYLIQSVFIIQLLYSFLSGFIECSCVGLMLLFVIPLYLNSNATTSK